MGGFFGNIFRPTKGDNIYWQVAQKFNLRAKIDLLSFMFQTKDVAIRFEIVGPKIQGNIYKLKDFDIKVFDIQVNGQYLSWYKIVEINSSSLNLPLAEIIYKGTLIPDSEMRDFAIGESSYRTSKREGLVWKPFNKEFNDLEVGRLVLKVINPEYDMKRG